MVVLRFTSGVFCTMRNWIDLEPFVYVVPPQKEVQFPLTDEEFEYLESLGVYSHPIDFGYFEDFGYINALWGISIHQLVGIIPVLDVTYPTQMYLRKPPLPGGVGHVIYTPNIRQDVNKCIFKNMITVNDTDGNLSMQIQVQTIPHFSNKKYKQSNIHIRLLPVSDNEKVITNIRNKTLGPDFITSSKFFNACIESTGVPATTARLLYSDIKVGAFKADGSKKTRVYVYSEPQDVVGHIIAEYDEMMKYKHNVVHPNDFYKIAINDMVNLFMDEHPDAFL